MVINATTGILIINSVLFIGILILLFLLLRSSNDEKTIELNLVESTKLSYGLFVSYLQEYDKYFISFEFGKFTKVKENELTESEYKILNKKYIDLFLEQYTIESNMLENIIKEIFGSYESFILYLTRRFDMLLLEHYPTLKLFRNNKSSDFIW